MRSSLDEEILAKMFRSGVGGEWTCLECGKSSVFKKNIWNHIEARHMTNTSVVCTLCGRTLKTRESLRKHVKADHSY